MGWAPAHAAHFSTWGDGRIGQSRDTRYRSAANLNGNHRVIAIENEDGGQWWEPLTDAQVAACGRVHAWANDEHGIPLQLCPDSRPGSRGLAYHRQGIDGNFGGYRFPGRVSGGEVWTNHFGKVCPGDARIAQLPDILDAAVTIARGGSLTQEDDEMTPDERKWLGNQFEQVDNRLAQIEEKLDDTLMRAGQGANRSSRIWRNLPRPWKAPGPTPRKG